VEGEGFCKGALKGQTNCSIGDHFPKDAPPTNTHTLTYVTVCQQQHTHTPSHFVTKSRGTHSNSREM